MWILLAAVLLAAAISDCGDRSSALAQGRPRFTSDDGILAARACVHEATWAGAVTNDCGGMIQVVETRRREHETFSAALRRTMPRFSAGRTARAWVLSLPAGPLTADPIGWPYPYEASTHAREWRGVYERVRDFMQGARALPCAPEPSMWFGRVTDSRALEARLSSGLWREAECGEGTARTRNAFLYGVDPD